MNEPQCCAEHRQGVVTPEFIAHLPTRPVFRRVVEYLNGQQDKCEMQREKARWN
jgi:hypothetical protein